MAGVARIPRRRGGLCGLLLILLGAWGALIPFIGPYFSFAYTPDQTWTYTSGRLYLSILPGVAAILGGLLVLATRSRIMGMLAGLLAAVGGAWFIVGAGIVDTVLKRTSIAPGSPIAHTSSWINSPSTWMFLEQIGFFMGVGALIIFFGAVAMGRFSMLAARDAAGAGDYEDYPDSQEQAEVTSGAPPGRYSSPTGEFPTSAAQFPAAQRPFPGEEPTQAHDAVPSSPYPRSPSPGGQS